MASTTWTRDREAVGLWGAPASDPDSDPETGAPALGQAAPIRAPRIWAVGGGKGGVGKSVVTSNLAAAIAGTGSRCAVIDADLGGANLHTLLGISRPRRTLSQLLDGDVASLEELLVQTSVANLWLVSGNQALLEMANPKHGQKEMLVRQIRGLDVDDVVLDLGAGSAYNVLDFFLLARRGLVVVTPEPTSIENAEHFLRAAFHRSLREVARRPDVSAAIRRLRENGSARRVRSAMELIALVRATDPPAAKPLEDQARAFAPMLLVNQAATPEHRRVGPQLVASFRERLGVEIELVGCLESDRNVAAAVSMRQPVLQAFPLCGFSRQIEALAEQLRREDERLPQERVGDRTEGRGCVAPDHGAAAAPGSGAVAARVLPPLDPAEPGAWLRRCREAPGLGLAELSDRTRIRILDQIEDERFDLLPPEPYLKGYLIEYARELGVADIAGLVKGYLARCPAPDTEAPPRIAPQALAAARMRRRRRFVL